MRFTKEKLSSLYEVPMEGDALAEQQVDIHGVFPWFLVGLDSFRGGPAETQKGNSIFQAFNFLFRYKLLVSGRVPRFWYVPITTKKRLKFICARIRPHLPRTMPRRSPAARMRWQTRLSWPRSIWRRLRWMLGLKEAFPLWLAQWGQPLGTFFEAYIFSRKIKLILIFITWPEMDETNPCSVLFLDERVRFGALLGIS